MKIATAKVIRMFFLLSLSWPTAGFAANTLSLTDDNNIFSCCADISDNGRVAWLSDIDTGKEIWVYDGENEPYPLADSQFEDTLGFSSPLINNSGQIAWSGFEKFFDGGAGVHSVADINGYESRAVALNNNGQLAWIGTAALFDNQGNITLDQEIFLHSGGQTTQLTDSSGASHSFTLNDNGYLAWGTSSSVQAADTDIYLYHEGVTQRITNDAYTDAAPKVSGDGRIAWVTLSGPAPGVNVYDGNSTVHVADFTAEDLSTPKNPFGMMDAAGVNNVIWSSGGDIYMLDPDNPSQTLRLTNSPDRDDFFPRINSTGQAVWTSSAGFTDQQVFFYDGTTTQRLDKASAAGFGLPVISENGDVVWDEFTTNDTGQFSNHIFLRDASAKPVNYSPPVETPVQQREVPAYLSAPNAHIRNYSSYAANIDAPLDASKPTILVVHGSTGDLGFEVFNPDKWVPGMAQDIKDRLGPAADGYNIVSWDWRKEASWVTVRGISVEEAGGMLTLIANKNVLNEGKTQGKGIASFLDENDIHADLHLIGFSAGGSAVTEAARVLTDKGFSVGQVTLLDAPTGLPFPLGFGHQPPHDLSAADWADNYQTHFGAPAYGAYNRRLLAPDTILVMKQDDPSTERDETAAGIQGWLVSRDANQVILTDVVTFAQRTVLIDDVALEFDANSSSLVIQNFKHGYAIDYYRRTINSDVYAALGFNLSKAGGGWDGPVRPNLPVYQNNGLLRTFSAGISTIEQCVGNDCSQVDSQSPFGATQLPEYKLEIMGSGDRFEKREGWLRSGDAKLDGGLAILTEHSPAYLFEKLTIPAKADFLSFDFKFIKPGDGDYLALHFNEDMLFWYEGKYFKSDEFLNAGPVPIGDLAGKEGFLTFSLNSFGEGDSQILLDNFKFYDFQLVTNGSTTVTPEPASMVLFGLGASALGAARLRRKKRNIVK